MKGTYCTAAHFCMDRVQQADEWGHSFSVPDCLAPLLLRNAKAMLSLTQLAPMCKLNAGILIPMSAPCLSYNSMKTAEQVPHGGNLSLLTLVTGSA